MSIKTIKGTTKLGESIKSRRIDLGLTIEEAALKAGVGTKSWCRYESGESIRTDKAKGICKALNWRVLPSDDDDGDDAFNIDEYKNHEAWSSYLSEFYGEAAAISFIVGSDLISDHVNFDLMELATMPRGTHIGQLTSSWIKDILPEQFLMRYDYDFMYQLKIEISRLRRIARRGSDIIAHTVIDELALYLFMQEAEPFLDCISAEMEAAGVSGLDNIGEWVFELFDDMDIVTYLYSDNYVPENHTYHFDNWTKDQFYM